MVAGQEQDRAGQQRTTALKLQRLGDHFLQASAGRLRGIYVRLVLGAAKGIDFRRELADRAGAVINPAPTATLPVRAVEIGSLASLLPGGQCLRQGRAGTSDGSSAHDGSRRLAAWTFTLSGRSRRCTR